MGILLLLLQLLLHTRVAPLTPPIPQAKALADLGVVGALAKNLFLKVCGCGGDNLAVRCTTQQGVIRNTRPPPLQDKKDKLYVITALSSTKLDLKGRHRHAPHPPAHPTSSTPWRLWLTAIHLSMGSAVLTPGPGQGWAAYGG